MLESRMSHTFQGLKVVSFESRRADQMAALITKWQGVPVAGPCLKEVPLEENTHLLEAAGRLVDGAFEVFVCMTGVGTRAFLDVAGARFDRQELVEALGRTTLAARGPKPIGVLRQLGLRPQITAPEPNTWRELLAAMIERDAVAGKQIGLQEYGMPSERFVEALEQAGGTVHAIPVYAWTLPDDLGPLKDAIAQVIAGGIDVALFTTGQQVRHVFQVAEADGHADALREAFKRVVVGSIGPVCSEALRDAGVFADHEPDRPHMPLLVRDLARHGRMLLERKRLACEAGVDTNKYRRIEMVWPTEQKAAEPALLNNSPFMKACRRELAEYTPIWIMRQAGRFMREYREFRAKVSFLELCKTPEYAAEVTLMAVDRLGVDAAIIFSDILLILEPMGVGLEYTEGKGPQIHDPIRESADVDRLREVNPNESLAFVFEALRMTRAALNPRIPLIGFAGAPFTLAAYLIEGEGSRDYLRAKSLMYRDAGAWHAIMERITDALIKHLNGQIAAGAQVVQLFDSWVGCLSVRDYEEFVFPYSKAVLESITPGTPVIHFGTGTGHLLERIREAGGDVIGLDWRVNLGDAWRRVGHDVAVQGNLDPAVLLASTAMAEKRAREIIDQAGGRPGHIFNLGHGVLPNTPHDNVVALVDAVHEMTSR
jgi:uroporphyrinogen decarboxylase